MSAGSQRVETRRLDFRRLTADKEIVEVVEKMLRLDSGTSAGVGRCLDHFGQGNEIISRLLGFY